MALAAPLGLLLVHWQDSWQWSAVLQDQVGGRPGVWRLVRGVLAYLAIPALGLAGAVPAWVTYQRSRGAAVLLVTYAIVANLTVQYVKHPLPWRSTPLDGLNPLSGHVGVAAGVAFGWLLVAPAQHRAWSTVVAVVVVGTVSVGVHGEPHEQALRLVGDWPPSDWSGQPDCWSSKAGVHHRPATSSKVSLSTRFSS